MGSNAGDLILSDASKKYLIPQAASEDYKDKLSKLLHLEKPDLIHFQNDLEILEASKLRGEILASGTNIFMPEHDVIEKCVNKFKSYVLWCENKIKVPKTLLVETENDLKLAFNQFKNEEGKIWLRYIIGGGGKAALPVSDYIFAKKWIDHFQGWGKFTAAEILTTDSITWLSIWHQGKLIVAQTRKRLSWNFNDRTLSGVTGITKIGETCSNDLVNDISIKSILAIDKNPHGIYGVDMTYDKEGIPNPTEINISRFFTTIYFFTKAGLNMPKIFKDIILYNKFPKLDKTINPLPDGLFWVRSMDKEPALMYKRDFDKITKL